MRKLDGVILIGLALVFLSGAIIGQGFNAEVKLGDFIALIATLITFGFAWSGLNHNERLYTSSIRPILDAHRIIDVGKWECEIFIENFGSGAALDIDFTVKKDGKAISNRDFQIGIQRLFQGSISIDIGFPNGLTPSGRRRFLGVWASSQEEFIDIMEFIESCEITYRYKDVQGKEFSNTYSKQ
ncbi:hypothetical protein [Pseudoalteromonas sp. SR41-7]|uniref:hypothetical protein n=1 Tax=Pseudoalteromonas sp. SR41-7 TaxID=2760947 RepID=UPI00160458B2|nr:hypothetical protein [Pseudoalteromonas sp. SR41-7]MBB1299204.1 hypothetical protein [Pseudoalteromonas sp. SR41-7]